jgi:imidazoleglycerol-phosphate dehydratase/histidinol-phosphatase
MDELPSLASAALDFSGRPYFVFDGEFKRERVGDLPTELVPHFFRSLCDAAGLNLNLKVRATTTTTRSRPASRRWRARCARRSSARARTASTKGTL